MNGHTEMNDSHEERDCTFPSGAALVEKNLVEQAVRSILQLPRCFITTSQSKRLFYIDACLALQLGKNDSDLIELSENALSWLQETEQVDLGKELEYSKNIKASPSVSPAPEWPTKSRHEVANKKALEIFELCEFCGEIIGWTKSMDARCANGHVFGQLHCPLSSEHRDKAFLRLSYHSRYRSLCFDIPRHSSARPHQEMQNMPEGMPGRRIHETLAHAIDNGPCRGRRRSTCRRQPCQPRWLRPG